MTDRERTHRENLRGMLDMPLLANTIIYGIRATELDLDETRALLCFVLKNPDTIMALVPIKHRRKTIT